MTWSRFGQGDGTFGTLRRYGLIGHEGTGLTVTDINRDNEPDLAVLGERHGLVALMFGTSSGTFNGLRRLTTADQTFSILPADFDGDGLQDLSAAQRGRVSIFRGRATDCGVSPCFRKPVDVSVAATVLAQTIADVDGDGRADIVLGTSAGLLALVQDHRAP